MKRKTIVKILWMAVGIFGILTVTLAVHIYLVTRSEDDGLIKKQLSRIEFNNAPLDSITVTKAYHIMDEIPYVLSSYINPESGALVYTVEAGEDRALKAFDSFIAKGGFDAYLYVPTKESLASSCPVINKKSVTYRLGMFFQSLFSKN